MRTLVVALAMQVLAGMAAFAEPPLVEVRDDRITARLDGVPVEDVLAAIVRATGATLRGVPREPRAVTAELEAVPLTLAMPRIVGDQSFTLEYGAGGRLTAIVLRGGPAPPPAPAAPVAEAGAPAPSPAGPPAMPLVLGRAFTRHRPVTLPEPLVAALGETQIGFVDLMETAAGNDDGLTRAQATQVVLSTLEREGRVRRAFLRSLRALDAESVAMLADGEGGDGFREMLEYVAAHSRERGLQKKTAVFLEQLRPGDQVP